MEEVRNLILLTRPELLALEEEFYNERRANHYASNRHERTPSCVYKNTTGKGRLVLHCLDVAENIYTLPI